MDAIKVVARKGTFSLDLFAYSSVDFQRRHEFTTFGTFLRQGKNEDQGSSVDEQEKLGTGTNLLFLPTIGWCVCDSTSVEVQKEELKSGKAKNEGLFDPVTMAMGIGGVFFIVVQLNCS